VGTRLAFDAAQGRLWVVCRACGRWNLSPLEERWEAIEECERLFRSTRLRYSTEQIGLARLPAGLDLVRIGRPQRPEFAAWRYGEQFRSRYRRSLLLGGGVTTLFWTQMIAGTAATTVTGGAALLAYTGLTAYQYYRHSWRPITRFGTAAGTSRILRGRDLESVNLLPSDESPRGWRLVLRCRDATYEVADDAALRQAGPVLAYQNAEGADEESVKSAVAELERVVSPERVFVEAARRLDARRVARAVGGEKHALHHLPHPLQLALEMAANEELEREAMEGELRVLEAAWREAEEIAAIADRLALPARIERMLARHRTGGAAPEA
jgi:hypothetical protein